MTYIFIHGLGQTSSSWNKFIACLPTDIKIYRPCLSAIVEGRQITYENLYDAFQNDCNRMEMPGLLLSIQNMIFRILPQTAFCSMGFSKSSMIALTTSMKKIDFTPMLDKIASPSFIICGQKDRANRTAARVLANTIPNAQLFFVEGAGHEVNIDAPAILADLIKECWFHEG